MRMTTVSLSETISLQEAIWTTIAVVAIGITAVIIWDNSLNFRAIRAAVRRGRATTWGPRYWVAFASLVSSMGMLIAWLGFAAIGFIAMNIPAPPTLERQAAAEANGWILIAIESVLASIQVWQVYARTKIRPLTQTTESAPAPAAIVEAAEQTRHAADLVDALRPTDDGQPEVRP